MSALIAKVIYSDDARRGKGTEDDPVRALVRLYSLDGNLICEWDGWENTPHPSVVYERGLLSLTRGGE